MVASEPDHRLSISPPPAWVYPVDIQQLISSASTTQEHSILEQYEWDTMSLCQYERHILPIPHTEALNALGNVEFRLNPQLSHRVVHHIGVWRNGTYRDCPLSADLFRFYQPEESRDSLVYDGSMRAMLPIDDIRVGDFLDIASTDVTQQARIPNRASGIFPTVAVYGAQLFRLRIRYPDGVGMQFSAPGIGTNLTENRDPDGMLVKMIESRDTNSLKISMLAAPWHSQVTCLEWSNYRDCSDVSDSVYRLWAPIIERSQQTDEITNVARQIYENNPTEQKRIDATIRFVQNEIRYLSLSEGIRSLVPEDPVAVLSKRYGDCKDKSILLVTLLRRMNIQAWPALVSVQKRHTVEQMHPMERAFDHAIASVLCEGKMYWVDPTISCQGGHLTNRCALPHGAALPILDGGNDLVSLPALGQDSDELCLNEELRIEGDRLHIELRSVFKGTAADSIRHQLQSLGNRRFSEALKSSLEPFYPNIAELNEPIIEDLVDDNQVLLTERYQSDIPLEEIPNYGACLRLSAHVIGPRIEQLPSEHELPVSIPLPFPCTLKHNIKFHHSLGLKWPLETIRIDGPGFNFEHSTSATSSVVEYTFSYQSIKETIQSNQLAEYESSTSQVFQNLTQIIPLKKQPSRLSRILFGTNNSKYSFLALIIVICAIRAISAWMRL